MSEQQTAIDNKIWNTILEVRPDIDKDHLFSLLEDSYLIFMSIKSFDVYKIKEIDDKTTSITSGEIVRLSNSNKCNFQIGQTIYCPLEYRRINKTNYVICPYEYSYSTEKEAISKYVEMYNKKKETLKETTVEEVTSKEVDPIGEFIKLQIKFSELYKDNSYILKNHIRKAYVEITLHKSSMKFDLDEETRRRYIKAVYRVRWNLYESEDLKDKPNKKMYLPNIIKSVSSKYGLNETILYSLYQTLQTLKRHEKNI